MFRLEMAALILALLKQVLWNQLVFLHVTSFLMTGVFAVLSLRVGCGWMIARRYPCCGLVVEVAAYVAPVSGSSCIFSWCCFIDGFCLCNVYLCSAAGWVIFRTEVAALVSVVLKQVLWNKLVFLLVGPFSLH